MTVHNSSFRRNKPFVNTKTSFQSFKSIPTIIWILVLSFILRLPFLFRLPIGDENLTLEGARVPSGLGCKEGHDKNECSKDCLGVLAPFYQ